MFFLFLFAAVINPIFSFPLAIILWRKYGRIKSGILSFWLAFAMGYIAYHAKSIYIGDLERYMEFLKFYKNTTLSNCYNLVYQQMYGFDLYFWFCAHFKDSRLLIGISGFILYFVFFYILLDYSKEQNISGSLTFILVFLAIMVEPFYTYISSLRSSITLCFAILAIYREFCKKQVDILTILLYILSTQFHEAGTIIVAMRLLYFIPLKNKKNFNFILTVFVILFGIGIFSHFQGIYNFGNILNKAHEYSVGGNAVNTKWANNVRSSLFFNTYKLYFLSITGVILFKYYTKKLYINSIPELFFLWTSIILGMIFFPTSIYLRYLTPFIPMIVIMVYEIFISKNNINIKQHNKNFHKQIIVVYLIVGAIFHFYNLKSSIVDINNFLFSISKGFLNFI